MPSGAFSILVLPKQDEDWEGDPIGDSAGSRPLDGVIIIPRTSPDDETLIIDGYQIVVTDTDQEPPSAEDAIRILDYPTVDPSSNWFIDGNVAPYSKASGDLKAYIFVVKSVR